jgi:hypothetical protein
MHAADLPPTRTRSRACDHSGLHTPVGRYLPDAGEIRYVTICDRCGTETGEVHRELYVPNFDPAGNDPYIAVA